MNIHWVKLIIAAIFEVGWVIGLKHADSPLTYLATVVCIVASFSGLIVAGRNLPVGTAYAVFVGLGTAGTVVSDMLLFGDPVQITKLVLIALLLAGVLGLKLVTDEHPKGGHQ